MPSRLGTRHKEQGKRPGPQELSVQQGTHSCVPCRVGRPLSRAPFSESLKQVAAVRTAGAMMRYLCSESVSEAVSPGSDAGSAHAQVSHGGDSDTAGNSSSLTLSILRFSIMSSEEK